MKATKTIRTIQEKKIRITNSQIIKVISDKVNEDADKYPYIHSECISKFQFKDTGMGNFFLPEVCDKLKKLGYGYAIEKDGHGHFKEITIRW